MFYFNPLRWLLSPFKSADKAFTRFLWGQLFSQVGENTSKVALPWLVLTMSPAHGARNMAILVLLQALPPLLFGWFYGLLIDKTPEKKTLLFLADFLRGIFFLGIPIFFWFRVLTPEVLDILVFSAAIFSGLFGPTMFSALPEFSDAAGSFVRRNTSVNMTGHIGLVVGPLLGGVFSSAFPPAIVLLLTGVAFLVSASFIFIILPKPNQTFPALILASLTLLSTGREILKETSLFRLVTDNTLYAPRLGRGPLLFTALAFLVGLSLAPILTLLPLYVRDVLHGGPGLLGVVITSAGLGMLTASGILGQTSHRFGEARASDGSLTRPETWLTLVLFLSGLLVIPTALITQVGLVLLVTFVAAGLADVFNPIMQTEVQSTVLPDQTGRVLTSLGTFFLVGIVAGSILTPTLEIHFGLFGAFVVVGLIRVCAAFLPLFFVTHSVYLTPRR